MSHLDHLTDRCELEVQKIIHLENIAKQLLDAFIDAKEVTKSNIVAVNVPSKIDISPQHVVINESETHQKHGRPVSSKDKNP